MARMEDITGLRVGTLTVLGRNGKIGDQYAWKCRCDCGVEKTIRQFHLKHNVVQSCGCLKREQTRKRMTTHGVSNRSKEYMTWVRIKQRCFNPKAKAFLRYGGRGILMDDNWKNSFPTFMADVGLAPSKHHSIDRIDNSLGYSKANCRWATAKEQTRNKSCNIILSAFGEKKLMCDWSDDLRCAVSYGTLRERVAKWGWDHEYAIKTPPLKSHAETDKSKVNREKICY